VSDFTTAFRIASSGLHAQRARLDAVASNLANAQTTRTAEGGPYRRREVVLESVPLAELLPEVDVATLDSGPGPRGVEVRSVTLDSSPPRRVYEPGHPDADQAGYVSLPNVDVVQEMVNMITASRSYAANAAVLETAKQLAQRAIDLMR
jgi:flagellar basal-body rod protein FlgC